MLEPGIGFYDPDGGAMGLPDIRSHAQKALSTAFDLMRDLAHEKGQPTKICFVIPDDIKVFKIAGQSTFRLLEPGDDEFEPTGDKVMYFTYEPA